VLARLPPLIAASLALSCLPSVPPHTLGGPPRLVDVRPKRSVAFVRSDVPLGGLRGSIERALPEQVTGREKTRLPGLGDVELSWRLARRPVSLRAEHDGLRLSASLLGPVSIRGEGVTCDDPEAGVIFQADTAPTLRPGGDLALDHLTWTPEIRGTLACGPIPLPVGPLLDKLAVPLARGLAEGVKLVRLPLGPGIEAGLAALRRPRDVHLGDEVGDGCLDLDPSRLVLAPARGAGAEMTLRIGVDVAPRITLGRCPEPPPGEAAPPPGPLVGVAPLDDRFALAAAIAVPYAELRALVAPRLVGQRLGEGGDAVTLDGLALGDASGRVLVEVPIHGKLNGTLTLWGTPALAEEGGRWILRVPDLQVALESQSLAQDLLLVAWKLRDGGLEAMMRSKVTFDVTDRLAALRKALSGRLAPAGEKGPVLTTDLSRIEPGVVASRPGALVLYPVLVGRAELSVP
jgi:Domain of unknown function (DUF4403)